MQHTCPRLLRLLRHHFPGAKGRTSSCCPYKLLTPCCQSMSDSSATKFGLQAIQVEAQPLAQLGSIQQAFDAVHSLALSVQDQCGQALDVHSTAVSPHAEAASTKPHLRMQCCSRVARDLSGANDTSSGTAMLNRKLRGATRPQGMCSTSGLHLDTELGGQLRIPVNVNLHDLDILEGRGDLCQNTMHELAWPTPAGACVSLS